MIKSNPKPIKIIGISCYYHDSAATLVIDGDIISAVQEERFTRKKHDSSFPKNALKFCLENSFLSLDDIDAVILGTSHNARYYPAVAIEIQNELGIDGYAYDMLVGCSSTTFAINNAYSDIASGLAETILVVNPEISTPAVNFGKRDIHFIFGDGCVASVIKKNSSSEKSFKILDRKLMTQF